MQRFKLTIEYDGSGFSGWQKVGDGLRGVQQALEEAAGRILGAAPDVVGAGRTDAGVHALAQIAHLDIDKPLTPFRFMEAMNAQLRPEPVAVLAVEEVGADFNARFSAIERAYWYRIVNRRADLTLDKGRAWRVAVTLDAEAMHAAALSLLGHHDFSTFRDAQCQAASAVKTLDRCDVTRVGEEVHVHCAARSFLHRQVRSMVGTLMEVGAGRRTIASVADALAARDRRACGQVAPAEGLYLAAVRY
jgi:tRNA pseudouridine38-40 synthase